MPAVLAFVRRLYSIYSRSHIPFFAAALAYYAIFSLMPVLFLLGGVFGFALSGKPDLQQAFVQRLTEFALALFPAQPDLATGSVKFLVRGAFPITLGSLLILLWSSSGFFTALSYALSVIFGRVSVLRGRIAGLLSPVLLGLGLILLSLLGVSLSFWVRYLPPELAGMRGAFKQALPLAGGFALFFLTYRFLPQTRPSTLHTSIAAALAALAWEGMRIGLPELLPRSQYELLYGPLAGVLLGLLGFYLTMWILLMGAVVAKALGERPEIKQRHIA